jgi:hypothetical protein
LIIDGLRVGYYSVMANDSNRFSHPNLPPLPQRNENTKQLEIGSKTYLDHLKPPYTKTIKVIAALCGAVIILLYPVWRDVIIMDSGPSFMYNVTGEGMFGNMTHPEGDDISYAEVKRLTDSSGMKSYYVVIEVTNYSSEKSLYIINVALVCDGFKKFEADFNIPSLLPSETKHLEQPIKNDLNVDSCLTTISVSRDAV